MKEKTKFDLQNFFCFFITTDHSIDSFYNIFTIFYAILLFEFSFTRHSKFLRFNFLILISVYSSNSINIYR